MREVAVTVVGNVGADPVVRTTAAGDLTTFSLGCTPRMKDKFTGSWRDGETSWFRVTCFGRLGANVAASVSRGERLIVAGRLQVQTYEDADGTPRTSVSILADHVGHELTFGTAEFTRSVFTTSVNQTGDAEGDDVPTDLANEVSHPAADTQDEARDREPVAVF